MISVSPAILIYSAFVCAILGGISASFVCCYSYRYLNGQSVLKGRSHCASCGHTLGALDLIPILSYVFLHGKCRYCGADIGKTAILAEDGMAAVFVLLLLRYDISPELLRAMLFVSVLLAVALIDLESFTIPDRLLGAAAAVWAVFMPFAGEGPLRYVCGGLLGGFAIAGAMLAMSLIADRILKKESMGGGDIKLFFVTGLYFGLMQNFFNLILSCVIGIIMALSGMGKKENGEGSEPMGAVPFGPAIAVSAVITMLAGQRICGWYLGLF